MILLDLPVERDLHYRLAEYYQLSYALHFRVRELIRAERNVIDFG